jgi:hypothetical protein
MAIYLTRAELPAVTLLGMISTSSKHMPWDTFYNLVLASAKFYDHSHDSTTKINVMPICLSKVDLDVTEDAEMVMLVVVDINWTCLRNFLLYADG